MSEPTQPSLDERLGDYAGTLSGHARFEAEHTLLMLHIWRWLDRWYPQSRVA